MGTYTSTSVTVTGTSVATFAASTSDTIANTQFGPNGVYVRVINGGSASDTVTIVDPNLTVMSSTATNPSGAVTNGTSKMFQVPLSAIAASTGLATIQHSTTTSVTVEVYKF